MKRLKIAWWLPLVLLALAVPPAHAVVDFMDIEAVSAAIKEIILEDNDDFFLPPGADGQLAAKTYPVNLSEQVRWAIVDQSGDLEITLVAETGLLVVAETSGTGWITVEASAEGCAAKTKRIEIGCECSGQSGPCDTTAGAGSVTNGSVDVRLSLGKVSQGRPAGQLLLYADKPVAALSTPEALVIDGAGDDVEPLYRDGFLMQVIAAQVIVTFVRFSPVKYEIHFYDIAFRGQPTEDGLYSIDPTAIPIAVWCFENPDPTGEAIHALVITETRNGEKREFLYSYEAVENAWTLVSGNGLKIESKLQTTNEDGDRVVRTVIAGPDGTPVRVEETVYRTYAFGEKRIRETMDPEGTALVTHFSYQTAPGPGYGKMIARLDPEGGWVRYAYDSEDRIIRETRPFLDAPFEAPDDEAVVVTKHYEPVDAADRGSAQDQHRPRLEIETVRDIETARSYYAYIREEDGARTEIVERCTRQGRPYGDPTNLHTETRYHAIETDGPQAGRIHTRLTADGRLETYEYEYGWLHLAFAPADNRFIPGKGKALRTTVTHGTLDHPQGIPFKTVRETTITDAMGREKLLEKYIYTEDGFVRVEWQLNTHDRLGRVIETLYANSTRAETSWGCCGRTSKTNADGLTTRFVYDDLRRLVSQIDEATGVATDYTYDAAGRRLSVIRHHGGLRLDSTNRYDGAGRLVAQVDAAGLMTRYEHSSHKVATIRPGGTTEIVARHLDRQIQSVTGTAVVARFYRYGINPDGSQWTIVFSGVPESPRWKKTTRDVAGRVVQVESPGFEGVEVTCNVYDAGGRLIRIESPGRAATLYTYDALSNRTMTGLDVDGDGVLRPASRDRIAVIRQAFKRVGDAWWREAVQAVFPRDNSARETIVSTRRQRLTGWKDRVIAEQVAVDIHGSETRAVTTLNRFKHTRIRTVHVPDSIIPAQAVYVDGRLAAVTGKTGITRTFGYDELDRRIAVEDPRKGIMRLHYDDKGRLISVEDAAGNRTRYAYDPETGRRIAEYNALNNATYYAYNDRGQLIRNWGDVPYPVSYRYNEFGQMVMMRTFRSGTGWEDPSWPEEAGPGDPTRWHYHSASGLLLAKEDALGNKTFYTYGPGGALILRTWARRKDGRALATRYDYDPATGDLLKIDYSDKTPDIEFAYNRLGRKIRVSDAAGVHHFAYDETLRLVSEGLTGPQIYRIARIYDNLGRSTGFELEDSYAVSYGYDAQGRFQSVNWRMGEETGRTAYHYREQSDLLAGMESGNGLSVHYEYEHHRDVKTAVTNRYEDRLISRYTYGYDPLGRRINARNSGEAFDEEGFWLYGYNDRNEVTSASRFVGSDLKDQTRLQSGWERVYRYDPIGNRIESVEGKERAGYRTNALNQYEAISHAQRVEESLAYDVDGNLVEDGRFRYRWNAESRLVAVDPKAIVPGAKRLEFGYDYLGRRFIKKVFVFDGTQFMPSETIHFVYDGWNMIRETKTNETTSVDRFYVWGLDLSRSLQGAGGVGGLLATSDGSAIHAYLFDGNGNVGQLFEAGEGSVEAHYGYDPFGKINPFTTKVSLDSIYRFSTKYFDKEIGQLYYGYRYYDSQFGKWINIDPIGERGGANLYGFVRNFPLSYVDQLGLVLVAVDGTDSSNWSEEIIDGIWNSHVRNFYEGYHLLPGERKRYWDGPDLKITGWDAFAIHKSVIGFLKESLSGDKCQRINLVGHSRGGYIVMEIAREIGTDGIVLEDGNRIKRRVNFLGLYDAVDMILGYGEDETIPSNVDYAAHAMGSPIVGSRPYFNTADHGPEDIAKMVSYAEAFFDATHGGMGGDPWGGDHPLGMTAERDRIGSVQADIWMRCQASMAEVQFGGFQE